ncbi:NnrU family protein [Pseudovibrio sp. Tun.PSC04-5.I4]|uniref:NnrU family protein n=1 Tax=Pseudovibrio sp. Tun.PSC04-5.I4 TaxID=1798213 RepID=UPI00088A5A93|nr:NnrU family protein [Pseudovibrio sp. Tun.PSC04-5.I4]SDQ94733.1 Uncharacterized membrane protein [Pseudovibrio sp. Tun.PSC04-5.I4]
MTILVCGLALFLAIHLVPSFSGFRQKLVEHLGFNGYRGLFTLASFAGLIAIIYGFQAAWLADYLPLYTPPNWGRHVAMFLMLPVFPFFVSVYMKGNITRIIKHPMINAVKLWAVAHLFANGEPYSVALFGSFLVWAVIVRISLAKRDRANPPSTDYPNAIRNDVISVLVGLGIYGLFVWKLHAILIGVPIVA